MNKRVTSAGVNRIMGQGMTSLQAPRNTDSIHRIAAAPGKTNRVLPADATTRKKPKIQDQLRDLKSR
jgi:hypothetical protein